MISSVRRGSILLAVAGSLLLGGVLHAQEAQLTLAREGQTIVLVPYAPNILRVTLSLKRESALAPPGYGLVAAPATSGWSASQTALADVYRSARLVATVDRDLPPSKPPVQTQIDIAKYFNGSDSRRAHHASLRPKARRCWN